LLQLRYTRDYGVSDAGECSFGLINEPKSVVKEWDLASLEPVINCGESVFP